jgi:hypothetical protein
MHRASRQMQVSARFGDDVLVADAECDVAAYHLEGLVPRTAASWGSTAFRAGLAEDFAAAGPAAAPRGARELHENRERIQQFTEVKNIFEQAKSQPRARDAGRVLRPAPLGGEGKP